MRLLSDKLTPDISKVSIHASVKDATHSKLDALININVSIHASVKDATIQKAWSYFQVDVSIHASVKDATNNRLYVIKHISVSIHASVKDATLLSPIVPEFLKSFNPRICKRCDGILLSHVPAMRCFNPRICKRCDSMFVKSFIDDTFKL